MLVREVTAERVKRHFGDLVQGAVERYELPNLGALNFLLHGALGGGGTVSLRTDAQGKTFGAALLSLRNRDLTFLRLSSVVSCLFWVTHQRTRASGYLPRLICKQVLQLDLLE